MNANKKPRHRTSNNTYTQTTAHLTQYTTHNTHAQQQQQQISQQLLQSQQQDSGKEGGFKPPLAGYFFQGENCWESKKVSQLKQKKKQLC